MQEVIARWDKFLATIDGRLREVLTEAHDGCLQLLEQSDLDPGPMGNAWTGMEARTLKLSDKVQDVWDAKVDDSLDDFGADVRDTQMRKGHALKEKIEVEKERCRVTIYATAARKIWERALAEAPTQLSCSQCSATLECPQVVASVHIECPHCKALNTYEPGMRARMVEHFCAHPLTEEAAWNEWMAMRQAKNTLDDTRDPGLAVFQAYERAQIQYWQKYYQARATMLPHYADKQAADVRGKMQYYYGTVENERVWAEAGRPRMIP